MIILLWFRLCILAQPDTLRSFVSVSFLNFPPINFNVELNTKTQKCGTVYQKNSKNLTTPNLNINIKLIYSAMNRPSVLDHQTKLFCFLYCFSLHNEVNSYLNLYNHVGSRWLEGGKVPPRLPGTSQTANQTTLLIKIIARIHTIFQNIRKLYF